MPFGIEDGRLVGPDGEEVDTEEFLASLRVLATADIVTESGDVIIASGDEVPFRVHTQKYGKQMVSYTDICSADGKLYLELDLTTPVCVECGDETFDGNSILFEIKDQEYIFVGQTIYYFITKPNKDKIVKFISNMGPNNVQYPFAYGEKKCLFYVVQ